CARDRSSNQGQRGNVCGFFRKRSGNDRRKWPAEHTHKHSAGSAENCSSGRGWGQAASSTSSENGTTRERQHKYAIAAARCKDGTTGERQPQYSAAGSEDGSSGTGQQGQPRVPKV